jgi:hypothetical protein
MKTELQRKLILEFPQFFTTDQKMYIGDKPIMEEVEELFNQKEMVLPIQFGVECGDGWFVLLQQLLRSIESHLNPENSWPSKERIPLQIDQIKEKFSGLRFYYSGGDDEVRGMVRLAERLSYCICEHCGSTINVGRTSGWLITICESCVNKLKPEIINGWKKNSEE